MHQFCVQKMLKYRQLGQNRTLVFGEKMIINVTYLTDSDMGIFESNAKLDILTGKLVRIEAVDEEDAQFIDNVYRTYISFNYMNRHHSYDVEPYENYIIDYEQTILFRLVSAEKLKKDLTNILPVNYNKSSLIKV
jgi:hypothetical protein